MRVVTKRLRWMAVGGMLGWFLDPVRGPGRQARAGAALSASIREARRLAERLTAKLPPRARTRAERLRERLPSPGRGADEVLREQIQRDVLRPAEASRLLVDVRRRRVIVRGEAPDADAVNELADRIRRVPGVVSVECRVHLTAGARSTGPTPG